MIQTAMEYGWRMTKEDMAKFTNDRTGRGVSRFRSSSPPLSTRTPPLSSLLSLLLSFWPERAPEHAPRTPCQGNR